LDPHTRPHVPLWTRQYKIMYVPFAVWPSPITGFFPANLSHVLRLLLVSLVCGKQNSLLMHCLTLKVGDRFTVREDQERLRDLWYACERAHGFPPTSTITQLEESWGWHNNWVVNTWNLQLLASYCYPTSGWSEVFSTKVSRNVWTNAKLPNCHCRHLLPRKLAKNDSWMFTVIVMILWLRSDGDFLGGSKKPKPMDYQMC